MEGRGSVSENRWPLSILRNDFHHVFVFLFGFQKNKGTISPKKTWTSIPTLSQPAPAISEVRGVGIGLALRNHREVVDIEGLGRLRSVKAQILRIWCCLGAGCPEGCGKITGKTPKSYAHVLNPIFIQQWSQFVKQQIVPLEGFERLSHRCFGCIANSSMIQLRTVTVGNPKTKTCCMLAQGTPDMLLMSSSMTFTASASEAFKSLEKPQVSSA